MCPKSLKHIHRYFILSSKYLAQVFLSSTPYLCNAGGIDLTMMMIKNIKEKVDISPSYSLQKDGRTITRYLSQTCNFSDAEAQTPFWAWNAQS